MVRTMKMDKETYETLLSASKVKWNGYSKKREQIIFLKKLHMLSKQDDVDDYMKRFLWKMFFPMLSWNLFLILYKMKKIKSKKNKKLSSLLFSKRNIRGSCIFTAIAAAVAAISSAASAAATTVATGVAAIGTAISSSTIASSAAAGIVGGAASAIGTKIVEEVVS